MNKESIKSESQKVNIMENYFIKEELKHIAMEKYIEDQASSKAFIESQIIDAEFNSELEKHLSDQSESEAYLNHIIKKEANKWI
jgi:hypothetical protein